MENTKKKYWLNAGKDLLTIIFFTTLPTIVSFILAVATSGLSSFWSTCYSSGEFILYSVALLSSSYILLSTYKIHSIGLIIVLIVLSICYAATFFLISHKDHINRIFLLLVSGIGMFIAFSYSLYSQYMQHLRSPDIGAQRKEEQNQIEKELS